MPICFMPYVDEEGKWVEMNSWIIDTSSVSVKVLQDPNLVHFPSVTIPTTKCFEKQPKKSVWCD